MTKKTSIYKFKSTQLFKMFQMTCEKLRLNNSVIYRYQCGSVTSIAILSLYLKIFGGFLATKFDRSLFCKLWL